MSKLAIVLFAVLFALIANADSIFSGDEEATEQRIEEIVDILSNFYKKQIKVMKNKVRKEVRKIIRRLDDFVKSSLVEIAETKIKISIELSHVAKGAKTSKCIELFEDLDRTAGVVVSNMSACVKNKLNIKLEHIKMINYVSKIVLLTLAEFRKYVRQVSDKVNGDQESNKEAIIQVGREAYNVCAINFLNLQKKISEFDELLRLHTIFLDCSRMSEYETLYEKLAELKYCNSRE